MREDPKRRDHRKIGAEMGLFTIDTEYVGRGRTTPCRPARDFYYGLRRR